MYSLILRTIGRLVITIMLLFSIFLLLRGHNEPGGGFVGGLVAASAYILYAIADGPANARQALHFDPRTLIAIGLAIAAGSGVLSLLAGLPFLTALWGEVRLPELAPFALGTPLLFDAGVYVTVLGVTTTIILVLVEEK